MNIGIVEIAIVTAIVSGSMVLHWQQHPFSRWGFALAFCFLLAGAFTPADALSTMVVGGGMSLCLALGGWIMKSDPRIPW